MKRIFGVFAISILYMELIYHFVSFGLGIIQPVLLISAILLPAGIQTMCTGFLREKANKRILWIWMAINYLIYASQLVYMSIFKQPLLPAAMANAGGDALSDYWREGLHAILMVSGYLLLLALPLMVTGILLHFDLLILKSHNKKQRLASIGIFTMGFVSGILILLLGYVRDWEYYEEYQGFYDPAMVVEQYGILPSIHRTILGGLLPEANSAFNAWPGGMNEPPISAGDVLSEGTSGDQVSGGNVGSILSEGDGKQGDAGLEDVVDTSPNVLPIDFDALMQLAPNEKVEKLIHYVELAEPTNKNEFTGMFEGYNLIYLTAEGFCSYAVDEQLTPTLYQLIHSGFVVDDYYVPLWQTSTSDGEYVNLTGMIPDQQFSMKRSGQNAQPFSLPAYFSKEGVKSYAYHNNTLSYYDRYISHMNLGYDFRASKRGNLPEEWNSHVFPMENADYWPASDLDMMKATIPEYINLDRFNIYYMTISGHMNYNFSGNRMSKMNQEAVAGLPYSEEGRAYIACNIELDKALEYLIQELDKAGKLEKTVICLSADHYPYGMTMDTLEELAGRELEGSLDLYKNSLILWNSEMDTITVDKTCSAMDIIPTLYNLLGFEYDSRLFAGRDMLSDSSSLVIFSNRSFITDELMYNRKAKTTQSRTEEPVNEEVYFAVKSQVKSIYEFSAGVLNQDFYSYVEQALPLEELQTQQ